VAFFPEKNDIPKCYENIKIDLTEASKIILILQFSIKTFKFFIWFFYFSCQKKK